MLIYVVTALNDKYCVAYNGKYYCTCLKLEKIQQADEHALHFQMHILHPTLIPVRMRFIPASHIVSIISTTLRKH